jgi:hypothetical protein
MKMWRRCRHPECCRAASDSSRPPRTPVDNCRRTPCATQSRCPQPICCPQDGLRRRSLIVCTTHCNASHSLVPQRFQPITQFATTLTPQHFQRSRPRATSLAPQHFHAHYSQFGAPQRFQRSCPQSLAPQRFQLPAIPCPPTLSAPHARSLHPLCHKGFRVDIRNPLPCNALSVDTP